MPQRLRRRKWSDFLLGNKKSVSAPDTVEVDIMDRSGALAILISAALACLLYASSYLDPKFRKRMAQRRAARASGEYKSPFEQYKENKQYNDRVRDERSARARAQGLPYCPYCGSSAITAHKRGYKLGRGLFWAIVLGGAGFWLFALLGLVIGGAVGLTFGSVGSGRIMATCLSCGRQFVPGRRLL